MNAQLPTRRAILERRTYEPPSEGRAKKLRLDFNENTSGCSSAVIRALAKLSPKQIAMYPEYERSTQRLADYFGVRPDELLLTNGGDDALRSFFDAFVDAGSSILICEPTFPMYRYYAEISGAQIKALRYTAEMEFPFQQVIDALKNRPRVLFIANPNNPTGTLLEPSAIETILHAAPQTAVVIDEAYAEFSEATVVPWIKKYPHLFVARTFSKAAGLAGLRLGAVMACAESIAILKRGMPPYPVNVAALVAAEAAVRDKKAIRHYVRTTQSTRRWFEEQLQQLRAKAYPSAANFLLVDFGLPGPELFRVLEHQGILVRERSKDLGPGFARITIGTRKEMERLIRVIRRFL
jgi:histidinol-phosphate aminotransferase